MSQTTLAELLQHLRKAGATQAARQLSDDILLERFLSDHDDAAFSVLVQRHGPMVLGLGQRMLGDSHEAEDCFQATFLVLSRRAGSIRPREPLGNWLYGVARRIALRIAAQRAQRRHHERQKANMPHTEQSDLLDELTWLELRSVLDDEIGRLPDKYRAPIVLCYLQGKSYDKAALELGCAKGTLALRIGWARELLREQLVRRGIGLSAGALVVALSEKAVAAPVGTLLAIHTTKAAMSIATSKAVTAGWLSARAIALAEEAVRGIALVKGKLVLLAMALGFAVSGAGVAGYSAMTAPATAIPAEEGLKKADSAPVRRIQKSPRIVDVSDKGDPAKKDGLRVDLYGDPLPAGAVARLGTVRLNHNSDLQFLHFLPDGKSLVSVGREFICLWDVASGKLIRKFVGAKYHEEDQTILSSDGKLLTLVNRQFNLSEGFTARIVDLEQGKQLRSIPLPARRVKLALDIRNTLSPDGNLCAQNNSKHIEVFDLAASKSQFQLQIENDEVAAVLFAGNSQLIVVDKKQNIRVLESRTGKLLLQFKFDFPATNLDPHYLAKAEGSRLAILEHRMQAFKGPEGEARPMHDRDYIHIYDLATGKQIQVVEGSENRWSYNIWFSADGKCLFASTSNYSGSTLENDVVAWKVETGKKVHELRGADGMAMIASPDGGRLAVANYHGKIELWDLEAGRRLGFEDSRHSTTETVALSPSGDRVITFGDSSISTWDAANGRRLGAFDIPAFGYLDPHRVHSFSPNGSIALSLSQEKGILVINLWDVATQRRLHILRPPDAPRFISSDNQFGMDVFEHQMTFAFSADSSLLAACYLGKEWVVRLWDMGKGKEMRSFKPADGYGSLCFSANCKTLLIGGQVVAGYDVVTGKELFTWERKAETAGSGIMTQGKDGQLTEIPAETWRALTFSPDGTIAAGILDKAYNVEAQRNRLMLCEAKTGKVIHQWSDSGNPARMLERLTFSPDGRLLATSDKETVHLWEVATAKEIRALQGHHDEVQALSFSATGKRLISAAADSTCLIWDLPLTVDAVKPLGKAAGEKELAAWWADLAGEDPSRAYAAIFRLADAHQATVPFLAARLKPVPKGQEEKIRQYIADLKSVKFAIRDKASRELKVLGPEIEPALRLALKENVELEVRLRLEQLLDNLRQRPMSGEPLRTLRALTVLENAGTAEARKLLDALALGAPGAWLTREAEAVRQRLALRER